MLVCNHCTQPYEETNRAQKYCSTKCRTNGIDAIRRQDPKYVEYKIENSRKWRINNPRKKASEQLRAKFGIDLDDKEYLFKLQGNKCANCEVEVQFSAKFWCVDHNHKTNKIRGILCSPCNIYLGHYEKYLITDKVKDYFDRYLNGAKQVNILSEFEEYLNDKRTHIGSWRSRGIR